ncbi:MAG: 5-formyltetrahydrofolate cyclo-ligase [Steroidobacteraceae bacterium]
MEKPVASSPCMLHELGADGTAGVDSEQARDVARWRKAERERLINARVALSVQYRTDQAAAIGQRVEQIIESAGTKAPLVSVYWPIRGEPDLRPWMKALCGSGVRVALPVALALGRPLVFREWRPEARLARGLWNIPYPADGESVIPNVVLAPLVGFDPRCYRLGYGGGFFDRTLAGMNLKPLTIGVGYPDGELRTIFPQSHDIPMDWVATGSGAILRSHMQMPED